MKLETAEIRIMVVDDEPEICEALKTHFELQGYKIDMAQDAKGALELSEKEPYHLVFADIKLPDMQGTELLARLREYFSETLVIMMTGYTTIERVIHCRNHGAFSYVLKSFVDLSHVDEALEEAIAQLNRWHVIIEETKMAQKIADEKEATS